MHDRIKRQVRFASTQFRADDAEATKRISGYFVVFNDQYELAPGITESVDPHALDSALGDAIRALIDHETRRVIGRTLAGTLRLRVDGKGLWGEIDINPDDTDATNLYARVKRGDVNQCSFGFDILDEDRDVNANTGEVHYTIKAVKLYEVSVCTFPAYKATSVEARAEMERQNKRREFEAWREKQRRRLNHGT